MVFAIADMKDIAWHFFHEGQVAGATVALFFSVLSFVLGLRLAIVPPKKGKKVSVIENERLELVRQGSFTFRMTERLVQELERMPFNRDPAFLDETRRHLVLLRIPIPWKPEEYIAVCQIEGLFIGCILGIVVGAINSFIAGLIAGALLCAAYYFLRMKDLKDSYQARQKELRLRLPYVVDLIALTRGAGASSSESFEIAAAENDGHPISDEFRHVIMQIRHSIPQRQALEELADRVRDDSFNEVVFTINKAEELGTAVTQTLSELARLMRLKRQQWGEERVKESEVKLVWPNMLCMVACMAIAVAPFLLQLFVKGGLGM